jgi:hypothetical protein
VRKPSGEIHNEVAGFIFATVGVLDSVLLAFIVLALWEGYGTAERAAQEASLVLATAGYAATLPEPRRHEMHDQLRAYAEVVLNDEWKTMTQASGGAGDRLRTITSYRRQRMRWP